MFYLREKKRETEREELWKRLGQLEAAHLRSKPLAASIISVDNNNKTSGDNSIDPVPGVLSSAAPIAAQQQ